MISLWYYIVQNIFHNKVTTIANTIIDTDNTEEKLVELLTHST